jgi:thiamine-phosphate pyrophosphorylase
VTAARRLPEPPLLVITDRQQAAPRDLAKVVAGAIAGGARWISLREKDLPASDRRYLLRGIVAIAALSRATLSVHDDVDAASELGLAGVHLPSGADPANARRVLGGKALIGVSAHSIDEAVAAVSGGADYVTLSPIFVSTSKPSYGPALGLDALTEARRRVPCPVVALGGITPVTSGDCIAAGASAIAVMSEIMRAEDPAAVTRHYIRMLRGAERGIVAGGASP